MSNVIYIRVNQELLDYLAQVQNNLMLDDRSSAARSVMRMAKEKELGLPSNKQ